VAGLLITGVHGQLGRALEIEAGRRSLSSTGRDVDTLDITDRDAVLAWIEAERPATVVNAAAFTAVDDCEAHEDEALAVNGTAVGHLADACNQVGSRLVQISTDYVFAGDGSRPYLEQDPVNPVSAYGRTKLRGEQAAGTAECHLIVRTAWLCGTGGHNFVEAIKKQVVNGARTLRVVHDQTGCPTFSSDLAAAILDLVDRRTTGIIHAVNSGVTTWFGFASEIVRQLSASVEVTPVASEDFPRPAPRPAYSVLDTGRLTSILGKPLPPWQEALQRYLEAS